MATWEEPVLRVLEVLGLETATRQVPSAGPRPGGNLLSGAHQPSLHWLGGGGGVGWFLWKPPQDLLYITAIRVGSSKASPP